MLSYLGDINNTVSEHAVPEAQAKPDLSPVTALDLALSALVEKIQQSHFPNVTFYSEENFDAWSFPLLALDPVDGTREYVEGRPEWALSIGLFDSERFHGEGWVYNPKTKEIFDRGIPRSYEVKAQYRGEVSRSEWKKGLFTHVSEPKLKLEPMGSIAYKLGRLSAGKVDFVVSLQPKNIWDIAGGTLLCQQAGLKFYSNGKLVTEVQRTYEPPLFWCPEELFSLLSKTFA